MLSIYATTKYHNTLRQIIAQEDRLHELVHIVDYLQEAPLPNADSLIIREDAIHFPLDWHNTQPPFILPEKIPFSSDYLLGVVFAKLGNTFKAQQYLQPIDPNLLLEFDFLSRLRQGISVAPEELVAQYSAFEDYRLMHNQAILRHYGQHLKQAALAHIHYFYQEAIQSAPNEEYAAFSARQYSLFLQDIDQAAAAQQVLAALNLAELSATARTEILYTSCQARQLQLCVPYDKNLLEQLKADLWEVLTAYEAQERPVAQGLVLLQAGTIANYSESWSEGLAYFNRAIGIFEHQQIPELAAEAHYRKGTLLFTWAQQGQPQFYRPAAESYQEAIKVFNQQQAPEVYAEIQHHLGIIYSEIPDEACKKSIWAAVSSAAFQEALKWYQKDTYPYDYAAVCNHYGNALTKYPTAVLSDNYEKAIYYYSEALHIRTAEAYPLERCLTLLNYLEAQWHLGMPEDRLEQDRYDDMRRKAEEVLTLTTDNKLQQDAQRHLEQLKALKATYA
ncbi:MAG: hypothetical protein D6772_04475 [Bacteroidetes bacterium]|nr:MAG: hypothetical protein D6772_04475 [Bacteroidota bacterium]